MDAPDPIPPANPEPPGLSGSGTGSDAGSMGNNWTEEQEKLLVSWSKDLLAARTFHHERAELCEWGERLLWIPNLVLIAVASALQKAEAGDHHSALLMAMNMASGALLALEKFLSFKGKAETHRTLCSECWLVYSDISFQLSMPPSRRTDSHMFIERVRLPYNRIVAEVSSKVSLGFEIIVFSHARPANPTRPRLRTPNPLQFLQRIPRARLLASFSAPPLAEECPPRAGSAANAPAPSELRDPLPLVPSL